MFVCRRSADKVVVFVTSSGQLTINEGGLTSVGAQEFSGTESSWASPDYEVVDLSNKEVSLPEGYFGESHKLVEDGDSYRWDAV